MSQIVFISMAYAFSISACLVPIIRGLFRRWGVVDKPDSERKLQTSAVSLGGGLAIFASVSITVGLVFAWASANPALTENPISGESHHWCVLLGAAAVLMLVGLLDDVIALRGRHKLLLQVIVVTMVVASGTVVQSFHWFGREVDLGIFAYPITALWLLATINALNLLDGADAMASTAGLVTSVGLAILCVQSGHLLGAMLAAALAGSLLGFLFYNFPPATIYLGDAGSMVIGLILGVVSIWSSAEGSTLLSFAPLMVLSVPLFDSVVAILRRTQTGRGIFAADRGHLHHHLLGRFSHPMMLASVGGLCAISSVAAIVSVQLDQQSVAIGGALLVLGLLVFTGCFGNAELKMLISRFLYFGDSLVTQDLRGGVLHYHRSVQLQGERCWDPLWLSMVDFAGQHGLAQINLDVNITSMQESYYGSWRRAQMPDKGAQISFKIPLLIDGRTVGRLDVISDARAVDAIDTLQLLIDRTEALGRQVRSLVYGALEVEVVGEASVRSSEWDLCAPAQLLRLPTDHRPLQQEWQSGSGALAVAELQATAGRF